MTLRFVYEVQADDGPVGDLQHLQHQVQVALQAGAVDDDDGDIGPAEEDEVTRHFFVGTG